jgi:predicted acylesterase/phospholipase RssA
VLRLLADARTTPEIGQVLFISAEAGQRHSDLVIKPRAESVGLLEFHQLDTAREAGRVAARQALERASAGPVGCPG